MGLIPHCLTPVAKTGGIRSLVGVGKLVCPLAHPALYPHQSPSEASPKTISGTTSYLQVRLAFHAYPQFIAQLFNVEAGGPPRGVTHASS